MKIICTQQLNNTVAGCSDLHQRKPKQRNREEARDEVPPKRERGSLMAPNIQGRKGVKMRALGYPTCMVISSVQRGT